MEAASENPGFKSLHGNKVNTSVKQSDNNFAFDRIQRGVPQEAPRVNVDPRKNFGLRRFLPDLLDEVDMKSLFILVDVKQLKIELRVEKFLLEA